jgi:probable HAF family extracellular repeat protein
LPGDTLSAASGINDRGEVIGASGNCTLGPIEAVLWQDGTPVNLGTLGGTVFNIAFGINNRGQVVGQSNLPGDMTHHAFLWQNGIMTDLGTIYGLPVSLATSINDKGQVVGFSQDFDSSNTIAWIWQDGVMTDLNTLIPADSPYFLIEALGINDRGQISGFMYNSSTNQAPGFVLTPLQGGANSTGEIQATAIGRWPGVLPENVRQILKRRIGIRPRWLGPHPPSD